MSALDSYIIQVKSQDELTVLIDKIVNTQAQRVYLLIPENSRVAQHALNFRLLKREADSLGKEIVVVSANSRVQALALKSSMQVHNETEELKLGARSEDSGNVAPKRVGDINPPPHTIPKKIAGSRDEVRDKTMGEAPSFSHINETVSDTSDIKEEYKEFRKQTAKPRKVFSSKMPLLPKLPGIKFRLPKRAGSVREELISKDELKITGLIDNGGKKPIPVSLLTKSGILKGLLALLVLISGSITAFVFYSILPSAKIYVNPVGEDVVLELSIRGDSNISEVNETNLTIPSQIFEKSESLSKTVKSSGEKEVKEKAAGRIRVYNSDSSEPQTLVKTTRFISEDGKVFRTTETVVVPGAKVEGGEIVASSIYVNVEASEAGEEYNIGPSSFSIPGLKGTPRYLAFYGKSEESISGGKIKTVKVVTESDYNTVVGQIRTELKNIAAESLNSLIPDGFIVPEDVYEISPVIIKSERTIGDEAETFSVSGTVSLKAFAMLEKDVVDLLKKNFETRFEGMRLLDKDFDIKLEVASKNFNTGIVDISVSTNAEAFAIINAEDLKNEVIGKGEVDVRRALSSYPGIREARVTFWPFWVNAIPNDPSRVEIVVEK